MRKLLFTCLSAAFLAGATVLLPSCTGEDKPKETTEKPADTTAAHDHEKMTPNVPPRGTDTVSRANDSGIVTIRAVGSDMANMYFDKTEVHVPAGKKVKIRLINEGTTDIMKHNFVVVPKDKIMEAGMSGTAAGEAKDAIPTDKSLFLAATPLAQPGASVEIEHTFPKKGEYAFICAYGGHFSMMKGRFYVE